MATSFNTWLVERNSIYFAWEDSPIHLRQLILWRDKTIGLILETKEKGTSLKVEAVLSHSGSIYFYDFDGCRWKPSFEHGAIPIITSDNYSIDISFGYKSIGFKEEASIKELTGTGKNPFKVIDPNAKGEARDVLAWQEAENKRKRIKSMIDHQKMISAMMKKERTGLSDGEWSYWNKVF